MWAKISHVLKPKQAHEDDDTHSPGDVLTSVFEQHPNLSVFNSQEPSHPSPPPSPSRGSRRGMFKRHTKGDDSFRAPSPMKLPIGLPKKVKSPFSNLGNGSQASLLQASSSGTPRDLARRSSQEMLGPSPSPAQGKRRSSFNILSRPAVDGLRASPETVRSPSRADERPPEQMDPATPFDAKSGSVRSILRDRNTPGTGQNVRFFSRDAYKVLTPDQSVDSEYQSVMTHPAGQTPAPPEETFLERLQRAGSTDSNASSGMPRFGSASKPSKSRPSLVEVFSPLGSTEDNSSSHSRASTKSGASDSQPKLPPIPAPDFTDFFDMSQELEIPIMPPPGLGYDVEMSLNDT
ncbi:hypothetical protein C8J57DRAFT_1507863 [Mycena rebaudengoi]|nr:hypothetical protein C8J57DRAFT_1507863 [Mycena rebaudengoi]